MNKLRFLGLSLAAGLTLASCGSTKTTSNQVSTTNETTATEVSVPKPLPQKFTSLYKDEDLKNWQHTNPFDSHMPGMSTEKAYNELLKDKPAQTVIVAVVDAGIDINHPDLKDVIWTNEDEIPNNGIDDDHNGYVDDVHGWNFLGAKDGKMAGPEQLELTRIVAKYRDQWKDKTIADIAPEDREIFELYQRAEKDLAKQLEDLEALKTRYARLSAMAANAEKVLKAALKTDKLTKEAVQNLKADNPTLSQAKQMYLAGLNSEALKGFKNYVEGQDKYNLNVNFNGRIQGDNPDDFNDRDYGNNNVIPPKADELHGTHVAGIIAQVRHNGIGGDGVADHVLIMPIRAVPDGDEYDKDIALAFRYAVDNGAKVINTSFGKYYSPHKDWVWDAIKYAADHDVLIVNAAGNDGKDMDKFGAKISYPNDGDIKGKEISDNFLNVGAIGPNYGADMVAPFSNYGKNTVDVFSPGQKIYATVPFGEYKFLQGTSMASPDVAGVAALIRSRYPELTASEVKHIIMDSGLSPQIMVIKPQEDDYEGDPELVKFDTLSKSGKMVNVYNAILLADQLSKQKQASK
ncbi:MAG TPA: peptidase S8 [Flavobacteriales bacterium]|nr:peptidase S8 [Flavobacteriales bacterium]